MRKANSQRKAGAPRSLLGCLAWPSHRQGHSQQPHHVSVRTHTVTRTQMYALTDVHITQRHTRTHTETHRDTNIQLRPGIQMHKHHRYTQTHRYTQSHAQIHRDTHTHNTYTITDHRTTVTQVHTQTERHRGTCGPFMHTRTCRCRHSYTETHAHTDTLTQNCVCTYTYNAHVHLPIHRHSHTCTDTRWRSSTLEGRCQDGGFRSSF